MFSHIFKGGFLTPFGSHPPNFPVDERINILQRVVTTYEQFMIAEANRVVKLVL